MPNDPMPPVQDVESAPSRGRRFMRWTMYLAAIALLVFCIRAGLGDLVSGWERLQEAPRAYIALMLGMMVLNILLDGWVFWAILVPFQPVRPVNYGTMTALMAATALLNYLPMRAGLIGRAAYLKKLHGVTYRVSLVMMLFAAAATFSIYALLLGATAWRGSLDRAWFAVVPAGVLLLSVAAVGVIRYGRAWVPGILLRYFDDGQAAIEWFRAHPWLGFVGMVLLLVCRVLGVGTRACLIWVAAKVFETPVDPAAALLIATGGMFVTLATPLPNGLGLREWVYGRLAAAGVVGEFLVKDATGMAIGLVERAMEALVFILTGLPALQFVHRRLKTAAAKEPT